VDESVRTRALQESVASLRDATIYGGVGCPTCRQTGYTGRHAIFELMTMSPGIRQVLLKGGSSIEIRDTARREGMHTLVEDGWRLVCAGDTTPAEVLRVSKEDDAPLA
jgi:type II secretory ATPase GspE/PulE/Tfp pilus assembly ATPase PilB-like protein